MSVYKHPSKPGWQMIKIFHGRAGKPEYIAFRGTVDEARMHERELRGLTDTSDPRLEDHLPEFRLTYRNRSAARSLESLDLSLKRLKAFFGNCRLRHITPMMIEQYKEERLATGVKKRTVSIELCALSAYISWVNEVKGGQFLKPKLFTRRETLPPLPQVLTVPEIAAIIGKLKGDMRLIVELMLLSGLRSNEVLNLTAANVDIASGVIRVHGKGGKYRMAPIGTAKIIQRLAKICKARPTGPLFPSTRLPGQPRKDIRKPITTAAKAAGITKHVHPHLLRHSFATALINDGTDIRIIQELLGHSELATTQRYTQIAGNVKMAAVTGLAAMVANVKPLRPQAIKGKIP